MFSFSDRSFCKGRDVLLMPFLLSMARPKRLTLTPEQVKQEAKLEREHRKACDKVWQRQMKLRTKDASKDEERTLQAMQSAKAILNISDAPQIQFFRQTSTPNIDQASTTMGQAHDDALYVRWKALDISKARYQELRQQAIKILYGDNVPARYR